MLAGIRFADVGSWEQSIFNEVQLQKAIWCVSGSQGRLWSGKTRNQATRISRLMVQRGIEMDSGLSVVSAIPFPIGKTMGSLKFLFLWQPRPWYATKDQCIIRLLPIFREGCTTRSVSWQAQRYSTKFGNPMSFVQNQTARRCCTSIGSSSTK